MKAVKRAKRVRKTRENGLLRLAMCESLTRYTYFLWKCGSKVVAGSSKKAGKVMRLKIPTTTMKPKMDEAKIPERFCTLR
jgi:hypothetical protein